MTDGEAGASSVASVFGVAIFLGFLMLASQVLIHLYATSVVNAVAFDSARRVAADGGDCVDAESRARSLLGDWGADTATVTFACTRGSDRTSVRISGPSPSRGLGLYAQLNGIAGIDRGASVRTEQRP